MKTLVLVLASFFIAISSVSAYSFSTKMRGRIIETKYENGYRTINLKVLEHLKESNNAFPVGTIFELSVTTIQDAGLIDNPKTTTYINKIILPNGEKMKSPVENMILQQLSSIKATWVPFYRTGKLLFEDENDRKIKEGSIFTIKKAKDGAKKVYAILE